MIDYSLAAWHCGNIIIHWSRGVGLDSRFCRSIFSNEELFHRMYRLVDSVFQCPLVIFCPVRS